LTNAPKSERLRADKRDANEHSAMGRMKTDSGILTDDCLCLLAVFVRVKDPKSRLKIIKFAQRFTLFDDIGMMNFNDAESPSEQQ
jgi:hypothetical protein